jgi:hypothetical protein
MFISEIQCPKLGSISKKSETFTESLSFLNRLVEINSNYTLAQIYDLESNKVVVSLRVVR